ncbi:hypothetical protein [Fodinicola acaciae]|uniref:hypothetical protein n=1 Tax=Fodinicola acaciae TaxID=2681555 RepID=UPI0013D2FDD4|nr:hypothetical protein [Fodinicola acaciae]
MPTYTDLLKLVRELKSELDNKAFYTLPRVEITDRLRAISGESTTRIKKVIATKLETVLADEGLRVYPTLTATTTGDTVRIYRAGTVLSNLISIITRPDIGTDRELADVITKIKGKWDWAKAE